MMESDRNAEHSKKRGFLFYLTLPISGPFLIFYHQAARLWKLFRRIWKNVVAGINTTKNIERKLEQIRDDVKYDIEKDKKIDFQELLSNWRIEEIRIPEIVRTAYFHIFCYLAASVIGIFQVSSLELWPVIYGSVIIISCTYFILNCVWKIQVLETRVYISFFNWILRRQ